jgi:hypothetical protein
MKNIAKEKTLSLNKETIASLNDVELKTTKGGKPWTWVYTCTQSDVFCPSDDGTCPDF